MSEREYVKEGEGGRGQLFFNFFSLLLLLLFSVVFLNGQQLDCDCRQQILRCGTSRIRTAAQIKEQMSRQLINMSIYIHMRDW